MVKPLFRKIIFPWYYAKSVQIVIIITGLAIMLFAIVGIAVAGEYEDGHKFIWVPISLLIFAAIFVFVAFFRLKRAISQKTTRHIDYGY